MVRKVRALLLEHQLPLSVSPTSPVAAPVSALTPVAEEMPRVPSRPREEVLMESLEATVGRPFAPQDFKNKFKEQTSRWPDDKEVKAFLNQMIRRGDVVVHQERKGRPGHLYCSLLPVPEPTAPTDETT